MLKLRSALQLRSVAEAKELPFSFLWERKGVLLTKRRPFLSQALSNPTARSRWRHSFALRAKRRWGLETNFCLSNLYFQDAGLGE